MAQQYNKTVSRGHSDSPAGPGRGYQKLAEGSAGSIDCSALIGVFVRVQVVAADAYVWFHDSATSTRQGNDSTVFEDQVPLLCKDGVVYDFVVPAFKDASNQSFLHYDPASGTPDILVSVG
jgi:hypothetical protein